MTRQPHDELAKEYLEELLKPFGTVEIAKNVPSEAQEIDLFFTPNESPSGNLKDLGLLGNLVKTSCLIEPFRNPCTPIEIRSCLAKLLAIHGEVVRQAKREKTPLSDLKLPCLWILTPTCSQKILKQFGARLIDKKVPGVYSLPEGFYTGIIVIHQLEINQDTLWLRVLGRGSKQKQAVEELVELPKENPFKMSLLELLANWRKNLELRNQKTRDDQEVIMNLSPAYLEDRQQWLEEGRFEGEIQGELKAKRQLIENFLKVRFQGLDEELKQVIPVLVQLPDEELSVVLLTLNREELLTRFKPELD